MKQRNGVLGLDTAKQVMVTFLILAITGIATILALTSLSDAGTNIIDTSRMNIFVTNESGAFVNTTGYELSGYNSSWSGITITSSFNETDDTEFNILNISLVDGSIYNATAFLVEDPDTALVSYYYVYTYDNGRTTSIIGNVSGGLVTFFGSTGTIFSILIVVVIILAISIIIWAVGRFGQRNEEVNL
jgi:hypothetical protein